jgi:enoyl-CoA hydratase
MPDGQPMPGAADPVTGKSPAAAPIGFTLTDGVAHLVLTAPDTFNALTPAHWHAMAAHLEHLLTGAQARVLVLSAQGKHFCAGLDLSAFESGLLGDGSAADRIRTVHVIGRMQRMINSLADLPIPTIAAIQGACVGGGLDIASACDIRYGSADAFFCIQEINIGIVADMGTLQRLPKLIPEGVVREYAYSGRRMPAARARELGLLNEIFDGHDACVEAAMTLAREIAAKAPSVVWGSKKALDYARDHPTADALSQIALLQAAVWETQTVQESVRAVRDKRAARHEGLKGFDGFEWQ